MVAIAQLVEHWIVIPGVAGSTPVGHPIFYTSEFPFLVRQISSRSVGVAPATPPSLVSICLPEIENWEEKNFFGVTNGG